MTEDLRSHDLAILGGGVGGYVAAIRAAELGMNVALIEQDRLGGVCLHRGCIPTKILYHSADLWSQIANATELGIDAKGCSINWQSVLKRKDRITSKLEAGINFLMKKRKVTVYHGRGQFEDSKRIRVRQYNPDSEYIVEAKNVIIATGSVPRNIPDLRINSKTIINAYYLLGLDKIPKSIILVGAGTTSMEFVPLWQSLGAEVTVIEKEPYLLPKFDKDIGVELRKHFEKMGVKIFTGTELTADMVKEVGDEVQVNISTNDKNETVSADHLVLIIGRDGNTKTSRLDDIGVRVKDTFIEVDENLQTSLSGVYAVGDVNGGRLVAHGALVEGTFAAEHIAGLDSRPPDKEFYPECIYCYPQVAGAGMSEDEAKAVGREVKVGKAPMLANSRAVINDRTQGFVKIVSDAQTGELLGVFMIGDGASELIGEATLAHYLESTPYELGNAIRPHPTLSEAIREAALAIDNAEIHF